MSPFAWRTRPRSKRNSSWRPVFMRRRWAAFAGQPSNSAFQHGPPDNASGSEPQESEGSTQQGPDTVAGGLLDEGPVLLCLLHGARPRPRSFRDGFGLIACGCASAWRRGLAHLRIKRSRPRTWPRTTWPRTCPRNRNKPRRQALRRPPPRPRCSRLWIGLDRLEVRLVAVEQDDE